ncbi:MAG: TetR/AcrR family transcriptional regulator [Myxococcaceae bacterium]|nr:TetR/AcrR family transcriptional regulator [Myxococcaceae bacterium]
MNVGTTSTSKQPTTKRGQRTRQALLEAAESVFGEMTFEQASIAEITRRAKVALGTFYVYFPHKQAIFVELVDDLSARLKKTLAAAVKGETTRLGRERAGFRAFFEFAAKHRNLYRVVRQAEFVDEPAYHRYYRTLGNAYAKGLSAAMAKGEIGRFEPEILAFALMGIADMIGMRFVLWESPTAIEPIVDEVLELVQHGLLSKARMTSPKETK